MREFILEFVYWIFGYRKSGTPRKQRVDKRDWKAAEHLNYELAGIMVRNKDFVNLETIRNEDQGKTANCVAYAIAHALTIMLRLQEKVPSSVMIQGRDVAQVLIDAGILTDKGAYILDSINYINDNGIMDNTGQKWKPTGFVKVEKTFTKFFETLVLGHPIITGGLVGQPYRDFWWFWQPSNYRDGGGHSELANSAYKERPSMGKTFNNVIGKLNSWYRWGIKKHGDRKSTRLNSSHIPLSRMPSSA